MMPETAVAAGLRVEDCMIQGRSEVWSPGSGAERVRYWSKAGVCLLEGCRVDERYDLIPATEAAMRHLQAIWTDPGLQRVGKAGLTLVAYNAGETRARRLAQEADPWGVVASCIQEGCDHLSEESSRYAVLVVATAAIVSCAAVDERFDDLVGLADGPTCAALARLAPGTVW